MDPRSPHYDRAPRQVSPELLDLIRRRMLASVGEPNPGARDTGMRHSDPYSGPYAGRPKPGVNVNHATQADLQALRERRDALQANPVTQQLADGTSIVQSGAKQQDKINAIKANGLVHPNLPGPGGRQMGSIPGGSLEDVKQRLRKVNVNHSRSYPRQLPHFGRAR